MNRITTIPQAELIRCLDCFEYDNCFGDMGCDSVYKAIEKLRYYENLESELEKYYGECEGLLETAVKTLLKHAEEIELGKPVKSRLITDEDVDQWLQYKS